MASKSEQSSILALLSLCFIILVFIVSFWFLRRVSFARPSVAECDNRDGQNRALTAQERQQLERRMQREAMRARREEEERVRQEAHEMAKPSLYQEKLRKREEERLARERAEAEITGKLQEQETNEYGKWKNKISISEEGDGDVESVSVEDFVSYIRENKIVDIETLSARFNLKPDQVISRLQSLEAANHLFGVIDDRGRYFFISSNEIDAIKEALENASKRLRPDEIQRLVNSAIRTP